MCCAAAVLIYMKEVISCHLRMCRLTGTSGGDVVHEAIPRKRRSGGMACSPAAGLAWARLIGRRSCMNALRRRCSYIYEGSHKPSPPDAPDEPGRPGVSLFMKRYYAPSVGMTRYPAFACGQRPTRSDNKKRPCRREGCGMTCGACASWGRGGARPEGDDSSRALATGVKSRMWWRNTGGIRFCYRFRAGDTVQMQGALSPAPCIYSITRSWSKNGVKLTYAGSSVKTPCAFSHTPGSGTA